MLLLQILGLRHLRLFFTKDFFLLLLKLRVGVINSTTITPPPPPSVCSDEITSTAFRLFHDIIKFIVNLLLNV